jgi:hypothetical protein
LVRRINFEESRLVVQRDLLTTVAMLRYGGLDAEARLRKGVIEVSVAHHKAVCATEELAADWLVSCAFLQYPDSDFARLWRMLAKAMVNAAP